MATTVYPINKPVSGVTTTVINEATTNSLGTTLSGQNGPPPTRVLGEFTGCPVSAMPELRMSARAISNVAQRTNVRAPWVQLVPRWSVMPASTGSRGF